MISSTQEMTPASSNDTSPTSHHHQKNNDDDDDHHELSSSASPTKQNKLVNLRQSSNHPLNCSCRSLTRRTYDEVLANIILPWVDKKEWNLDHWDPDALPNSTGSKQLDSFYVLREIFLFVHFDMETLLAVASVNRAWRCLADRLPHWRYLLPMKYELPDVVAELDWHLPRAWVVERIPYEVGEEEIYKTNYHLTKQNHASRNTTDDSKYHHYRLRQIQPTTEDRKFFNSRTTSFQLIKKAWLDEHDINSHGRKTAELIEENEKLPKEERDKLDLQKLIPKQDCSCATCCLFTCFLPCVCCWKQQYRNGTFLHKMENQLRGGDFDDYRLVKINKVNRIGDRNFTIGLRVTAEDKNYAEEAVVDVKKGPAVDWFKRLGGGGGTTSQKKNKEQQQLDKNPPNNDNAYEIVDAVNDTHEYDADKDMDFDYNDFDKYNVKVDDCFGKKIEENYDEVILGSKNINGTWNVDNSNDDWYHQHSQHHLSSEQQLAADDNNNSAAAATSSAFYAVLSSDPENNSSNNMLSSPPPAGSKFLDLQNVYSGCIAEFMQRREELRYKEEELAIKEAEKGKRSIAGRIHICQGRRFPLSSGEIYHEDWPIVAPTCVYTQLTRSSLAQVDHGGKIKSFIERNNEDTSIIRAIVHNRPRFWTRRCLPAVRVTRMTLLDHHEAIMSSPVHRRKFCFLTLSSFTDETKMLIEMKKKFNEVHFCSDLNANLPQLSVWSILAFGIALLISLATSTSLHNTVIAPSDLALGSFVGCLCAFVMMIYFCYFFRLSIVKLKSRIAAQARATTLCMVMFVLMSLMVPLSLVSFRVTILDDLVSPSRKISSICDMYADQLSPSQFLDNTYLNSLAAASSVSPPENAVSQQQCDLPSSLLPSKIASSTFVHFPEGTKFLYHPPLLGQNLPFTSRFDSSTSKCQITRNETLAFTNESYRQTKSQITRGNIGYYTILSTPSSCQQQRQQRNYFLLQPNTTFLIISENSGCPYWSVNNDIQVGKLSSNQSYKSLQTNIHPRLQPVLRNQSASDALQAASGISNELEKAIEDNNYHGSNAPIVRMPCQHATNSLVEVKNNNFYLRVASGFSPHFSASYYNERESVWSDAPTWKDSTDDYKKNGIVALMADSSIFIAHESPAVSDTVPNLLSSPFSGSSDAGNPSVWTQATPEGLDYLQNTFHVAYLVLVLVMVIVFVYTVTFNLFFSRGMTRGIWKVLAAFLAFFIILFPLPTLVITSICESNAVDLDKDELLQPVFCLMGNGSDIKGAWIFTIIIFIISCPVVGILIVYIISSGTMKHEKSL